MLQEILEGKVVLKAAYYTGTSCGKNVGFRKPKVPRLSGS